MFCRMQVVFVLVAVVIGCGCVDGQAGEKTPRLLSEVRAEDAPVEYIQRECLPILNDIVDSLCAAREKFPELAHIQPRHIKEPFGEFIYDEGGKFVPGQKDERIEPGGCLIVLFLEPFGSSSHAKRFLYREYDGLSIRFNYEFRLGTPNDDLQKLFDTVLERALVELAKKEEAFRTRKRGTSQQTTGDDAEDRAPHP